MEVSGMRYLLLCLGLLLFPLGLQAGDVACQYDCLAKGGLPEICDSKCGIVQRNVEDPDQSQPSADTPPPSKSTPKTSKVHADADVEDYDFACIKKCRDAGNKLKDCKSLCLNEE
jgi:hypothetical protein